MYPNFYCIFIKLFLLDSDEIKWKENRDLLIKLKTSETILRPLSTVYGLSVAYFIFFFRKTFETKSLHNEMQININKMIIWEG